MRAQSIPITPLNGFVALFPMVAIQMVLVHWSTKIAGVRRYELEALSSSYSIMIFGTTFDQIALWNSATGST